MGGPMSVNDDLPYLRREEQSSATPFHGDVPVLGICLGAQLIARALGAAVYRNPAKEIGWFDLRLHGRDGRSALRRPRSGRPYFTGTERRSICREGAGLLASSDLCRNQAFRVGDKAYGIQFHLEVTPDMIAEWCVQDENCGDVRELTAPLDPQHNTSRLVQLSTRVFGAWCDLQRRTE